MEFKTLVELFSDPSRHTKGVYARNAKGECVNEHDGDAVCFCLSGAIARVYGENNWDEQSVLTGCVHNAIRKLCPAYRIKMGGVPAFNDHKETTVEMIQAVVKEAEERYAELKERDRVQATPSV
jgi:hypothetical protein